VYFLVVQKKGSSLLSEDKKPSENLDSSKNKVLAKRQSSEPETMEELLSQTGYKLRGLKRGDNVSGVVMDISGHEVRLDIGAKTEGVIGGKEFEMAREVISGLKVGDSVTAFVTQAENDLGQILLSLRRAGLNQKWRLLEEKKNKNEPVSVLGVEVNRGGLLVDCEGLRGFIPASQIDPSREKGASELVGGKVNVLILEIDQTKNRLILSEKALTGGTISKAKAEALAKIKIGETYSGTVSGVVPFGVFVTVEIADDQKQVSADGLVHISEIAWEKVTSPSDYFKVGQNVRVMVLGREEKSGKLNLSIKQLTPNPWVKLAEKYSKDQVVSGKVIRIAQFGAFIELEPGLMGLIHISKIPSNKELKTGEMVECSIEAIDAGQKRISLAPVLTEKPLGYK
jgi:small subunit ribosomal protein S1